MKSRLRLPPQRARRRAPWTWSWRHTPLDGSRGGFTPARVSDSRNGIGSYSIARIHSVTGIADVPTAGVSAVVTKVVVSEPTASVFLTVRPAGEARPTASNLTSVAGQESPTSSSPEPARSAFATTKAPPTSSPTWSTGTRAPFRATRRRRPARCGVGRRVRQASRQRLRTCHTAAQTKMGKT